MSKSINQVGARVEHQVEGRGPGRVPTDEDSLEIRVGAEVVADGAKRNAR